MWKRVFIVTYRMVMWPLFTMSHFDIRIGMLPGGRCWMSENAKSFRGKLTSYYSNNGEGSPGNWRRTHKQLRDTRKQQPLALYAKPGFTMICLVRPCDLPSTTSKTDGTRRGHSELWCKSWSFHQFPFLRRTSCLSSRTSPQIR